MTLPRLLLILFLSANALAAVPLPPEKEQWLTLTSGEFHIYSNASARETRQIATDLLRMREAVGKVTRMNVRSTQPVHVFLFRNERSFAALRDALFQRRNAGISGGFITDNRMNFIVLQADAPGGVARVVYHELTHYFVRNTLDGLPLWFHEGVAEYYSTFASNEEKVDIGRAVREYIGPLRGGHGMPLAQLFAADETSPEYREEAGQEKFYAQSWALMHYFFAGNPQRRVQLGRFLDLLRESKPAEEAFRTAFEASYADVEKELRSYLNRPTMPFVTYSLDELKIPAVDAPQPLARDELLARLGQLLTTGTATLPDAITFFQEAIQLNPRNAEAYAALGIAHEQRDDLAAASAAFEKAVSLGSNEPFVYLSSGIAILNRIAEGNAVNAPSAELVRARRLFERAAQLDPKSPHAWAGIGATYVGSEDDPAPGIAALEKSLALQAQEEPAINLVQLYAKSGRRADAQRVFDTVLVKSKNAEVVRQGRESVLLATMQNAEELMAAGRYAEGAALMREIHGQTRDERLKEHLGQVLAEYDQHAASEQHVGIVETALEKARSGKYAEALKIVDELLPKITDADMRKRVQELRRELAAAVKRK